MGFRKHGRVGGRYHPDRESNCHSVAVKKVTDFGATAIKTIKGVSSVVKAIPSLVNPVGLAVTGVTAAVAGIAYATYRDIKYANDYAVDLDSYTQHLIDKQDKLNQKTEEQNRIREEWEDKRKSATDSVDREYTYYQNLSDALENIVDENGKIKEGYENRAQVITGELSDALGIEISIVDGQIQKYDELKTKIEDVMATKKANALLSANEENYIDAQQQLSAAGSEYADNLDNQKSLERRLTKMQAAQSAFQKTEQLRRRYGCLLCGSRPFCVLVWGYVRRDAVGYCEQQHESVPANLKVN